LSPALQLCCVAATMWPLSRSGHARNIDRTYVGRMLRLTSLAPDIIEAILRGDEPDGLSLEKLRKDLPVRWEEQGMVY
jgi:hypothetical protein